MTTVHLARHLTQLLGRIELVLADGARRCCETCGCLCRRGETCPNCALANSTRPRLTQE